MAAIGKIAFWAGMMCELLVSVSGFAFGGYKEPVIILLGMMFFSISILTNPEWKKNWKLYIFCAVVGLGYYYIQSSALILRILLILLAGRRQKPEQVVKFFFWGTFFIMIFTAVLSVLGIHNAVSLTQNFRHEEETRYCFGFYHPNGFSFFLFRTMLLGLYSYGNRMPVWGLLSGFAFAEFLFFLSGSKMGLAAGVCVIIAFLLIRVLKTEKSRKYFYGIGVGLMLIEIGFLFFTMIWFRPSEIIPNAGDGAWQFFNEITTGRLYFIHNTFVKYPIPLFGYRGFMEATEVGFVNALYNQGSIFAICYLIALFYTFHKKYHQKDMAALVLILGFTFYAMAEAFLPYFNKNGVWMMLLGMEKDNDINENNAIMQKSVQESKDKV
ncbi:MAG: hypothetical protein J6K26_08170 [Lachnospiraceae bacterium]|nr:hypothetical protein [Lachnospiraceae bacterium]